MTERAIRTIGWIGTGNMGRPMAAHLMRAGYPLVVLNRASAGVTELAAAGARTAATPRALARECDAVFTMLPGTPEVEAVVLGPDGVRGGLKAGGLFVDMGVLVPRAGEAWSSTYAVSDPFVVGWRSMTVALIDQIAPLVRERLQIGSDAFSLAKLLEGGTWEAGRRIARERRADGGPPFQILSDGTVF